MRDSAMPADPDGHSRILRCDSMHRPLDPLSKWLLVVTTIVRHCCVQRLTSKRNTQHCSM